MRVNSVDDDFGTVRWFGPTWGAPINDPRAEVSIPLGENCIECGVYFDHGDPGVAIRSGMVHVFFHRNCFLDSIGVPHG